MLIILKALVLLFLLTGCSTFPTFKMPEFAKNTANSVVAAKHTADAVDRLSTIEKRTEETRKTLEIEYAKERERLRDAINRRDTVDDKNFDRISEINYGIFKATEPITSIDPLVLIAHLKSKENMVLLMPLSEDKKAEIVASIESERKSTKPQLEKTYEARFKESEAMHARYVAAHLEVKKQEDKEKKLYKQQAVVLEKLRADQEIEREKLQKETASAVNVAKEAQRLEMLGWIVKALLATGIIILVFGFILKSPTFILSGVASLGLAYVAATIPFWIVSTIMGVLIVIMIVVDPKTGKICFCLFNKKEEPIKVPPIS